MNSPRVFATVDKRSHPRVPLHVAVLCEWNTGERTSGHARDIGGGGMFIEAAEQPAFGAALTVVLQLPGALEAQRLPAVVRWTTADGFGVQFGLLDARTTYAISQLLR